MYFFYFATVNIKQLMTVAGVGRKETTRAEDDSLGTGIGESATASSKKNVGYSGHPFQI